MDKTKLIFNMYKDMDIGAKKFRAIINKQYNLSNKEITDLYAKINNYQIKKYGNRIGKGSDIILESREEYIKKALIRRVAKYQKRGAKYE